MQLETHMQIKIIGDRQPWIDGQPREAGYECDVDADLANHLIDAGMAEKKMGRPSKKDAADELDD